MSIPESFNPCVPTYLLEQLTRLHKTIPIVVQFEIPMGDEENGDDYTLFVVGSSMGASWDWVLVHQRQVVKHGDYGWGKPIEALLDGLCSYFTTSGDAMRFYLTLREP